MNILFISTMSNFFRDDSPQFPRMSNFVNEVRKTNNVIVLQPERIKGQELSEYRNGTRVYYYREIIIHNRNFRYFTDFNLRFLITIKKIVKREKIDIIHLDFPYGGILLSLFIRKPIIYSSYDISYRYQIAAGIKEPDEPRLLGYFMILYLYFLEFFLCRFAKLTISISTEEVQNYPRIFHINPNKFVHVNNGVPDIFFENPLTRSMAIRKLNLSPEKKYILFHGYYRAANKEAFNNIIKIIAPNLKQNGEICFLLAGKIPNFKAKNIQSLGYLDNLKSYLYAGTLAIAPLQSGTGMKTKVIDYISAGLPLILTKKGAEGLDLIEGKHYILSDTIEKFPEKIVDLLRNDEKYNDMKNDIKEWVTRRYRWSRIGKKLRNIYKFVYETYGDKISK